MRYLKKSALARLRSSLLLLSLVAAGSSYGCSSLQVLGRGEGTLAVAGPVSLEAWDGHKRLKKFIWGRGIHIVGLPEQKFTLLLRSRSERYYKVVVRSDQPGSTPLVSVLQPYMRLDLKELQGDQAREYALPSAAEGEAALTRLGTLKIALYGEQKKSVAPIQRIVQDIRRRYNAHPSHVFTVSYGVCKGYAARSMFSKWCPDPRKPVLSPPPMTIIPEPYIGLKSH